MDKTPHCCPVCQGKGQVSNGFYNQVGEYGMTSDATPEMCRSCNGTGIVWQPKEEYCECENAHSDTMGNCTNCQKKVIFKVSNSQ